MYHWISVTARFHHGRKFERIADNLLRIGSRFIAQSFINSRRPFLNESIIYMICINKKKPLNYQYTLAHDHFMAEDYADIFPGGQIFQRVDGRFHLRDS